MAISAQELNVILSARDKQFTKAMERAQRRVEKFSAKSQKDLSRTTRAVNTLSVAAGKLGGAFTVTAALAGLQQMFRSATETAFEIDKLSKLAGVGTERFQELAFAARSVGVDQEKLADILKDTNDKFGDFFLTGAGPLADFFETIAPKVGITAEAFKGLSSDQALGLYVQKLQEAGVNQQELTFFLEALASDATLLAPLLVNNADALNQMATEARDLGVVIDQDLIGKSARMRTQFDQVISAMQSKFQNFAMTVVVGFDAIFDISEQEQMRELQKEMDRVQDERGRLAEKLRNLRDIEMDTDRKAEIEAGIVRDLQKQSDLYNSLVDQHTAIVDNLELRVQLEERFKKLNEEGNTGSGLTAPETISKTTAGLVMMKRAMDDLDSIAGTLENSLEDVFMSAIDGADSFKDTVRQTAAAVVRELYRVLVVQRLVNAAMGFFGVSSTPTPSPTGNAAGGAVYAGQPTVVGEHGRELFVPSSAGRILSVPQAKAAMGGGESVVINQTINVSTGVQQTVRNEIKTLMPQIAESAKSAVADAKRRGGSYGRAFA